MVDAQHMEAAVEEFDERPVCPGVPGTDRAVCENRLSGRATLCPACKRVGKNLRNLQAYHAKRKAKRDTPGRVKETKSVAAPQGDGLLQQAIVKLEEKRAKLDQVIDVLRELL